MKKIILLGFIFYLVPTYSQIGINVPLPLQPLQIDGAKNNPLGTIPNVEEAKDDFVITKDGNVGLGVYDPKAKLDINGKLRVIDGNQGNSKVMMSDAFGNLNWSSVPYIVPTVLGQFESGTSSGNNGGGYVFSKGFIILTKGRWIVNAGLTLYFNGNQDLWLQAILSSSKSTKAQAGFTFSGNAGNNTAYASRIKVSTADYSLLSGSSVINVTAEKVTIYLLILNEGNWSFNSTSWENYFYAIPVL